jgi:hypothetical protein
LMRASEQQASPEGNIRMSGSAQGIGGRERKAKEPEKGSWKS